MRHLSFSFDSQSDLDTYTELLVKSNPQLIGLKVNYIDETPITHLCLIRDSLPNLVRLKLDVKTMVVDKEPFKPLLFKHLRYLCISGANSQALKLLVFASTFQLKRLELSIEGNIDTNCINFLKRHQSEGNFSLIFSCIDSKNLFQLS